MFIKQAARSIDVCWTRWHGLHDLVDCQEKTCILAFETCCQHVRNSVFFYCRSNKMTWIHQHLETFLPEHSSRYNYSRQIWFSTFTNQKIHSDVKAPLIGVVLIKIKELTGSEIAALNSETVPRFWCSFWHFSGTFRLSLHSLCITEI